jgi:hypothetical protein
MATTVPSTMKSISRLLVVIGLMVIVAGVAVWGIRAASRDEGSKGSCSTGEAKKATWLPQRFELKKVGAWELTVPNLDTTTWQPASYKLWANKPYKVATTDPKTKKRIECLMPTTEMYWYGAPGGIGHLEVAAIESGTIFMAQRVR